MTPLVHFDIVVDLDIAVLSRRDHGLRATFDDVCAQPVGIESLVGEQHVEFQPVDQ